MKDLEKQIEEAVIKYPNEHTNQLPIEVAFYDGAKSPEAKEYWQHGMYSEEEAKKLALLAAEYAQDYHMKFPYEWFDEWFEQNKKK